ncbi:histone-lysine n-methyltransferase H3 lysine-36 H4 lysine-20 specific [Fusarium phyllophilum]|uniref:Histone-lysine n-methyltransferase H3 lysine-36 H4 lysine-20 specific n=1 Tax=Fusarium phyllophilum TaxID=47803 RepID=A0A8H5I3K7_9HYPO|nr:histone-lysine n-methyltransferase H3 lysine-36 H4 lysine-20 specific [Fusarium phyllophilum]
MCGSKHALITNSEVTRDKRKYILQRLKHERLKASLPPRLQALVRQMRESRPAKIRHSGGYFLNGPLRDQEVAGLPQFFEKSGRLKQCYIDIVNKPEFSLRSQDIVQRTCNMSPAQPFPNKSWFRGSDLKVTTLVSTNVWTPDKYPDWKGPPGFLAGQDPTWIPSHLRQFVRQDVPAIRKTTSMGDGAWAETDYEAGELVGELVGEIAPIGTYTDGWAADLSRDDLSPDGENVVWCQVYPRYIGNWVRKVNHSCPELDSRRLRKRILGGEPLVSLWQPVLHQ